MTLTFNARRATVVIHTRTRYQDQRPVGSKAEVEGDYRITCPLTSVREYVFSDFKKHDFLRFFEMTYQKVVKSH